VSESERVNTRTREDESESRKLRERERERERERISDWILEKPSSEDLTTIKNEQRYLFLERRRRRRSKRNAYSVKVSARCD
jgi:hypothetical protein